MERGYLDFAANILWSIWLASCKSIDITDFFIDENCKKIPF